jgi:hypothetical protein
VSRTHSRSTSTGCMSDAYDGVAYCLTAHDLINLMHFHLFKCFSPTPGSASATAVEAAEVLHAAAIPDHVVANLEGHIAFVAVQVLRCVPSLFDFEDQSSCLGRFRPSAANSTLTASVKDHGSRCQSSRNAAKSRCVSGSLQVCLVPTSCLPVCCSQPASFQSQSNHGRGMHMRGDRHSHQASTSL